MQKTLPIKENKDFIRIYKRGKSFVCPTLVVYAFKNRRNINRIGITTSKKIGKAVVRNRARRVIREAYRSVEPKTKPGWDLVIVARGKTAARKSTEIAVVLKNILANAGVLEK